MKITKVWAVYFSPTGNTKKVITTMAKKAAEVLSVPMETFDFTLRRTGKVLRALKVRILYFSAHRSTREEFRIRCYRMCRALLRETAHCSTGIGIRKQKL